MKAVFRSGDNCAYTLNIDDTVTLVDGKQCNALTALFPSASNSKSVRDAVFVYENYLVKGGKKIYTNGLIKFNGDSTIRMYRNVFLIYDYNNKLWFLICITVL